MESPIYFIHNYECFDMVIHDMIEYASTNITMKSILQAKCLISIRQIENPLSVGSSIFTLSP